jgi:protoheme IX farnesyltransferase
MSFSRFSRALSIYLELAKARLATLVVLTAAVGHVVASGGRPHLITLSWTIIGTALTAFGANILNQWREIEPDRRMHRTRERPLPSGRISRTRAATWGASSALVGIVVLAGGTNNLTAALSLLVILLYVLVYTPMKRVSPLNTLLGAVCGAVPPMMGWTAATGRIELGAWILFAILFLWQIPHFLALAWLYREDYHRGGFRMLPSVDPSGRQTGRAAVVYALALLPLSAIAYAGGLAGVAYLAGSQILGLILAALALGLLMERSATRARRLFLASILYLPLLLALMVADPVAARHEQSALGHMHAAASLAEGASSGGSPRQ